MTLPLRPSRGGFLRPFGCGWFIREFLAGNAPYGSQVIDPLIGAPRPISFTIIKWLSFKKRLWIEQPEQRQEKRKERNALSTRII